MAEPSTAAATDAGKSPAPKNKLVRDSFTIPKAEYAVLNELKQRATRLTQPAKKSELLRAGIALLQGLPDQAFLSALAAVPNLKPGRPPKDGEAAAEPGEKLKRHVKDKTAPKTASKADSRAATKADVKAAAKAARPPRAGANGTAATAAKAERVAARAARVAAKPQKAARADKPAKVLTPEKQAAKAAKQAAKGRGTT